MSEYSDKCVYPEEEDAYANAYFYFAQAINVGSRDPLKQCEAMGWYNVAWELRDDASRGAEAVLKLAGRRLSNSQKTSINHFLLRLSALPDSVVMIDNTRAEHLRAMGSPFWASLRSDAMKLKDILASETTRVTLVLWPETPRA